MPGRMRGRGILEGRWEVVGYLGLAGLAVVLAVAGGALGLDALLLHFPHPPLRRLALPSHLRPREVLGVGCWVLGVGCWVLEC